MKNKKLYLIPYAHLDTQWRWNFATSINHYLKKTLHDNFSLFEKYPGYCFNFTGSIRYRMIKDYYPEEYEKMKDYITNGRWKIAGSCLDETDAILPSPESLIRNILYGNIFNRKEFNTESYDYFLPDCFGFPASFPSILKHCGLSGFSTQKLTWGSAVGIPFSIGMWKAPDGSRLPVAFDPGSYVSKLYIPPGMNIYWQRRIKKNGLKYDVWKEYKYYGTGDIGGAPGKFSVRNAERSINKKNSIIIQDSADKFFKDLTDDEMQSLPEYSGDLLLTEHSTGSLTSQAIMKRWNRKNELLAAAAEAAATAAWLTGGQKYPGKKLSDAWERVIGSQMHDILPGTSTPDAYTYSNNDEVIALNTFSSVLEHSVKKIAENLDTETPGMPIIIYNPLSFKREDLVEAEIPISAQEEITAFDTQGVELPVQVISINNKKTHVIFPAKVPSLSWNVFTIKTKKSTLSSSSNLKVEETTEGIILENHVYRVRVNKEGFVDSIFDKAQNIEILKGTIHYELQREKPLKFPAWNMDWRDRKKKPIQLLGILESIKIIEKGPVRIAVEITRKFEASTFIQKISLSTGSPGNRVEFTEKIEWNLSGYSLKTAFPLKISNAEATYNWQVSKVKRNNNHKKKFEVPSHMWFDLTDKSGTHGISILEDSKFGSDKPNDNTLRLTLLYTPARRWFAPAFWDQVCQDWGKHTIKYAIYSHKGNWAEANSDMQGLRFNQPLFPFSTKSSPGVLGKSFSLLNLSTDNSVVSAVKLSEEDKDTMIIRMIENSGKGCKKINLHLQDEIIDAWEVNGQEIKKGRAKYYENKLETDLSSFQIKAFAIKPSLIELKNDVGDVKPVDIPYNTKIFTRNGENPELEISFPQELIPGRVDSGDIFFQINKNGNDTLICSEEKLKISNQSHNRLSLLVSALEDTIACFTFTGKNEKTVEVSIQSVTEFVGQYDTRIWKRKSRQEKRDYVWRIKCTGVKPGFIKRQEIAYYTTHMHSHGKDLPYQFGYMFRIDMDIPDGADGIKVCDNNKVMIFAATLSNKTAIAENCRFLIDEFDY